MMSEHHLTLHDRAAELRARFDETFSRPPRADGGGLIDLLAIRVGEDPYALRLSDIAGLHADTPVTWVPTPVRAQLGIASFRRRLVPVFDLRLLLGTPGGDSPCWLVLTSRVPTVAIAFDLFEGHEQVTSADIVGDDHAGQSAARPRELVRIGDTTRAIIDIVSITDSITDSITNQFQTTTPTQER